MNLKGKRALITGGSAGIGKAILIELKARGVNDFAIVGRTQSKLDLLKKEFPETNFILISADISSPKAIEDVVSKIKSQWNHIDLLINNAGVVSAAALQDLSDDDIINQININLTGLILLTKKSLPLLLQSEEAAIMNISSGLGLIAKPFYSVYAATKAAVKHFSEAMRRELINDHIHVMTVYPTATDTDMMTNAKVEQMDSVELVAKRSIEGLVLKHIDVILGGEKRLNDVETNKKDPLKIDQTVQVNYEAYRERTKNHRSM
jgi:short-subunit dehydrogenase